MSTRKKIDELYRERLGHVETTPPAEIWQNISDRLPEKRDKRILPLWYTLAGTAAAIALLFLIFGKDNMGSSPSNTVTIRTAQQNNNENINFEPTSPAYREYMNTSSAIMEAATLETRFEIIKQELKVGSRQYENGLWRAQTSASPKDVHLAEGASENKQKDLPLTENPLENAPYSIAQLEKPAQKQEQPSAEDQGIAEVDTGIDKNNEQTNPEEQALASEIQTGKKLPEEKLIGLVSERSDLSRRFSITPTAAAVYFDNFGSGNLLDDQFSNKEGGGEISMSYGVNLAYQLSEKFKLRSGISKVNLAYTTRAVDYATALNSQAINVRHEDNANFPNDPDNSFSPVGSLNQNLGFIEIPLEIEYKILNKKTGINLIGGVSTLFLQNNGVALNSGAFSANLGEANNINDLSFSANFGVGLHYKITPLFQFNLEPILKYQINTFNNTSNLHSYYFGIYSGLSFKF